MLVETGQTPFEVVHTKAFVPVAKPETDDVFNVGVVIAEPPKITDQIPVPMPGIVLFKFVVGVQIV